MAYIHSLNGLVKSVKHRFAPSFFTASEVTASELLLKGAVGPVLLWACFFTYVQWLA